MDDRSPRTRTHRWEDPDDLAEATGGMSGQEFFEAWRSGEVIPPIAVTLAFDIADFGDGRVELTCEPDEFHYNPYGTVHGGLAATLLDTATGCAIHSRLPAGAGFATLDLQVNYLRPITRETGTVRCFGKVLSMGRRVAVAEADLLDPADRRLARATSTCLLRASA